ncbi:hypothetical protein Mp_8g13480 [Marchantia polymorpha subsp. ruderalis]|uniref:Uncharacterized protein n=1 Tax=Marchantia polymorpha TaxID=3197 RepID=A0A2R6WCF7_MARPO|nr:hypothetical protein MARPO_0110s0029 [Marchantia polymorpha]BBN19768.1 hypothetical protein Mp_8g13480 [Marchantia polymorpha subsp. ruderalis]|eukprot:PTQ31536.1 hypothetical protein MARPO_0110s0029 [Marchantia polymorpha]
MQRGKRGGRDRRNEKPKESQKSEPLRERVHTSILSWGGARGGGGAGERGGVGGGRAMEGRGRGTGVPPAGTSEMASGHSGEMFGDKATARARAGRVVEA